MTESFPKGIQRALPDGDHRAARSWDKLYILASSADLKVLQCLQLWVVHPHLSFTTAIYCHLWVCLFFSSVNGFNTNYHIQQTTYATSDYYV